jgi:hypothetical protein
MGNKAVAVCLSKSLPHFSSADVFFHADRSSIVQGLGPAWVKARHGNAAVGSGTFTAKHIGASHNYRHSKNHGVCFACYHNVNGYGIVIRCVLGIEK